MESDIYLSDIYLFLQYMYISTGNTQIFKQVKVSVINVVWSLIRDFAHYNRIDALRSLMHLPIIAAYAIMYTVYAAKLYTA